MGIPAHVALGVVELAVCPCGGAPWTGVNHVLPRPQRHHRVVPLCRRAMGVGGPSLCVLRGPQVHSRLLREASVAQRWKKSRSTCDTTGVCASSAALRVAAPAAREMSSPAVQATWTRAARRRSSRQRHRRLHRMHVREPYTACNAIASGVEEKPNTGWGECSERIRCLWRVHQPVHEDGHVLGDVDGDTG